MIAFSYRRRHRAFRGRSLFLSIPAFVRFCGLTAILLQPAIAGAPVPLHKPAGYPAWWFEREVIARTDPANNAPDYNHAGDYPVGDDYLPLTRGQLKQFALCAYDEFQAHMFDGASPDISAMVKAWCLTEPATTDFLLDAQGRRQEKVITAGGADLQTNDAAFANRGQLKAVAKLFYDQLIANNFRTGYPWAGTSNPVDDFSMANVGQAKNLFSFDLTLDSNQDGLSDLWSAHYGVGSTGGGANDDPDGDGLTNAEEQALGTDPTKKDNPAVRLTAFGFAAP
jgi:hypothetical protein